MHDIMRMVETEIMQAMFMVHTLRWRDNDTPLNNAICVIVLLAAWAKRTRGLGGAPTTGKGSDMGHCLSSSMCTFWRHECLQKNLYYGWHTDNSKKNLTAGDTSHFSYFAILYFAAFLKVMSHDVWTHNVSILPGNPVCFVRNHFDMISHSFRPMWSCPVQTFQQVIPVTSRIAS